MAIRTKAKRATSRRRTVAVPVRSKPTGSDRKGKGKGPVKKGVKRPAVKVGGKKPAVNGKPVMNGKAGGNGQSSNGASTSPATPHQNGYVKALKFFSTLIDHERLRIVRYNTQNFDLDRMRTLLKKLGNPHEQFKSVHVAGTKGKGSTCAMTAAMLQACGYKVGLYTSPHLVDIRERIQINGEMIAPNELTKLIKLVEPIVMKSKPMPTFFDVMTAIAFKYFADQKVDIAVVETGLGGRLDSTNVLKPEVSAVTSIS